MIAIAPSQMLPPLACLLLVVASCARLQAAEAELINTIPFNGFVANEVYPVDVDGDGQLELLCLQSPGIYQSEVFNGTRSDTPRQQREIYCLTAISLDGQKLWQIGKPNLSFPTASSHVADQMIWPLPAAKGAKRELAVLRPGELLVLDAETGVVKRSTELRSDNFGIVIGALTRKGCRLVVQNTEKSYLPYEYALPVLIYDAASLKLVATISEVQGSGHSPRAVDLNGDGEDEILLGYDAYGADGMPLWRLAGLGKISPVANHVDQLQVGYFGDAKQPQIVYAGSFFAVMGTSDGKLLWKQGFGHPQHVLTGNFRTAERNACIAIYNCRDLLGEAQESYLKKAGLPTPPKGNRNNIAFLNAEGEIVSLVFPPSMKYHSGEGILLYPQGCPDGSDAIITRDWGGPEALDMAGEQVFSFQRPPAQLPADHGKPAGPGPDGYGVRVADFNADGRAEVLIHDQTTAWIYQPPYPQPGQPNTHAKLLPVTGQGSYGMPAKR